MAEIYRGRIGRYDNVEHVAALAESVQDKLGEIVREKALVAEARLAGYRNQGHSRIVTERGDVDHYVVLDDERGLSAALSIEYGRAELEPGDNPLYPNGAPATEGLFVLHRAFGLNEGSGRSVRGGDDIE